MDGCSVTALGTPNDANRKFCTSLQCKHWDMRVHTSNGRDEKGCDDDENVGSYGTRATASACLREARSLRVSDRRRRWVLVAEDDDLLRHIPMVCYLSSSLLLCLCSGTMMVVCRLVGWLS